MSLKNKYQKTMNLFKTISILWQANNLSKESIERKWSIIERRMSPDGFYEIDNQEKIDEFLELFEGRIRPVIDWVQKK